jgi:leucyl aminopeptidase
LNITVERGNILEQKFDLLALGFFESEKVSGIAKVIDESLNNQITHMLKTREFEGKYKQIILLHTMQKIGIRRILLVGFGKRDVFNLEVLRQASGAAAKFVRNISVSKYAIGFLDSRENIPLSKFVENIVIGSELSLYEFLKYKTEDKQIRIKLKNLTLFNNKSESIEEIKKSILVGQIIADGVSLARDISNTPSSDATPELIAGEARKMAKKTNLSCTILDIPEMEKLGMGGMINVGRGSTQSPKFVILTHNGGKDDKPIVIVGKGITFDSGGISLKPSEKMEEMKHDKSGAASVIGIMKSAAQLQLPLNIIGIIPLTENLPSGSAYKPGDVLKIYNGKTVEIISTDAEGRLILADALAYASKYKPQAVVDLATLTGACIIALGTSVTGLLSNDDNLKRKIINAGEKTEERVWELPLWDNYKDQIKSDIADMKNVGGRAAGTITAASFLSNFVEYPWAHLDIAGTAWTKEGPSEKTYNPKGATGIGVRLIIEALREWYSK